MFMVAISPALLERRQMNYELRHGPHFHTSLYYCTDNLANLTLWWLANKVIAMKLSIVKHT